MQLFKQLNKNISKHKLLLCSELNVQLLYLRGEKKSCCVMLRWKNCYGERAGEEDEKLFLEIKTPQQVKFCKL